MWVIAKENTAVSRTVGDPQAHRDSRTRSPKFFQIIDRQPKPINPTGRFRAGDDWPLSGRVISPSDDVHRSCDTHRSCDLHANVRPGIGFRIGEFRSISRSSSNLYLGTIAYIIISVRADDVRSENFLLFSSTKPRIEARARDATRTVFKPI